MPHAGTLEIGITPSIFTKTGKPKILADGSNLAYGFNQSLGNKSKVFSAEGMYIYTHIHLIDFTSNN